MQYLLPFPILCSLKCFINKQTNEIFSVLLLDNNHKISRPNALGLNDLEGLKKENKESKETGVDRPQTLR